jgi:uncharacterized protein involved in exopolysaccharide biosynthesis
VDELLGLSQAERLARLEAQMAIMADAVATNARAIDAAELAVRGRPSWPVLGMITFLSTGLGISTTALIAHLWNVTPGK